MTSPPLKKNANPRFSGVAVMPAEDYPKRPYICEDLPVKFLKNKALFPVKKSGSELTIVMGEPDDVDTIDAIKLATGCELTIFKGDHEDILKAIDRFYAHTDTAVGDIVDGIASEEADHGGEDDDVSHLRDLASEAPVIKLVNLVISKAVDRRASDIHIEPFENAFRVRYRIDDILHEAESLPKHLNAAVTSRIKIMANLDIAERRLPQDGRIKKRVNNREIDFRVATVPTAYGESVVMRILDRSNLIMTLEDLGFSGANQETYEKMISRPYGMVLITGPTGSGKTTSLYATLEKLNFPQKKIITIEDPVEYHLYGINQIQVKPQIGLTFADGLRHIVRQDPNIIMVGEIRDKETAEIAINSALTGHLVFSTLHTNDATGTVARLLEMGIEDYLLASSLIGIVAQRLVRVICENCKEAYFPDTSELKKLGAAALSRQNIQCYRGKGCAECGDSGYKGREGIFEILPMSSQIKSTILSSPEASVLKSKAVELGMSTLREDGFRKILAGETTLDEVIRVTQED